MKAREILKKHGLSPSKKRGQNFLVRRSTIEAIIKAAGFSSEDRVVEVGVGLGALTIPLARCVAEVVGIEVDSGIIRYHQEEYTLPSNVTLVHDDILRTDFEKLRTRFNNRLKIIANLPYSISNPFIFSMLENRDHIDQVVVMLQKEVAERLTAEPGTKQYGIPGILLSSCATVDKLLTLSPDEFHPRPKIDSQVIRISFQHDSNKNYSFSAFKKVVRASFSSRRKTLLNNLSTSSHIAASFQNDMKLRKEKIREAITAVGLSPECRAECLSVEQFELLNRGLEEGTLV